MVKTIIILILRTGCFFHFVDIYINGGKVMVGKVAGNLTVINAAASNYTCSHCILQSYTFAIKKKKFPLIISLMKQ